MHKIMAKLVTVLLSTADMLLLLFKLKNDNFVGNVVGLVKAMARQRIIS